MQHTTSTTTATITATAAGRSPRRAARHALPVLALGLTALLAACGASGGADDASPSTAPLKTTTTVASAQATTTAPPAPTTTAASTGSGTKTTTPTTAPAPSTPKPTITSFTTPDTIDCHNGMSQMFTASWSVANATKVTISIDGPGIYKTYAATDSDSFPFGCQTSHSYLLTAYGADGSTATKTITLQPRNVQPTTTGTTEAP